MKPGTVSPRSSLNIIESLTWPLVIWMKRRSPMSPRCSARSLRFRTRRKNTARFLLRARSRACGADSHGRRPCSESGKTGGASTRVAESLAIFSSVTSTSLVRSFMSSAVLSLVPKPVTTSIPPAVGVSVYVPYTASAGFFPADAVSSCATVTTNHNSLDSASEKAPGSSKRAGMAHEDELGSVSVDDVVEDEPGTWAPSVIAALADASWRELHRKLRKGTRGPSCWLARTPASSPPPENTATQSSTTARGP